MRAVLGASAVGMLLAGLAGGCAFVNQKATLRPHLTVASSSIGAGKTVALSVADERTKDVIGRRGVGGGMGGSITTDQDVAAVVRAQLADGLQRNGFAVTTAADDPRRLNVEVRSIDYELVQGFWAGSVNTSAALKAEARNGDQTFDRMYRSEQQKTALVVPGADKNEALLNTVVSQVLDKMLQDRELLDFLAR